MATKSETKQANQSRVQAVKALHEQKNKERLGEKQVLKSEYLKLRDSIVLKDILAKSRSFSNYHVSVGRDGVGANKEGETIYFTNEKRVSEFDRSAGQQEIIDYITRMIEDPAVVSPVEELIDAVDEDESTPVEGEIVEDSTTE